VRESDSSDDLVLLLSIGCRSEVLYQLVEPLSLLAFSLARALGCDAHHTIPSSALRKHEAVGCKELAALRTERCQALLLSRRTLPLA